MGKLPKRTYDKLYVAEWLAATGKARLAAAEAADVDESYLSNIMAGRKKNPSAYVLVRLSDFIGCTVNDLYKKPPPPEQIQTLHGLSNAAIASLTRKRSAR